jgi:putative phosphoserine phosphatase / 1-acylglycerol-3-phosphate O-acyltransferase
MSRDPRRLPGSVAEIEASPDGPQIGAFFDLDGTLIAGYSAKYVAQERFRNREVNAKELVRTVGLSVMYGAGRADFADFIRMGAEGWRGRHHEDLEQMGERLFRQKIEALIYPEMREIVRAHQQRGHTVVLSSSATSYQVEPVARYLGIDRVICNRFTEVDGVLTGDVEDPVIWGETKASSVRGVAEQLGVDMDRSYFYADGDEDLALMYLVGHPRPTNPGKRLERVAAQRGWPVLQFTSRGRSGRVNPRLRSALVYGSLVPLGGVGLGLGLIRRSKQETVNFVTPKWIDVLLAVNEVRVEVAGREHLWSHRPAVFLFNHRNSFDPLITARLIERDFSSVAKKELRTNPVIGTFGRFAGVAFVDRTNPRQAVAAMEPLREMLDNGLSVLVAPEGTRYDNYGGDVGPFKKGAFRLAMAAGVPLVPMVIHDAERIGWRDAKEMIPGTVHVTVLPPVSVEGWTMGNYQTHMEEVRRQYLDTLSAGFTPDAPTES